MSDCAVENAAAAADRLFAAFYRERLVRASGARLRSSTILSAYEDWAESRGAASIGFREMRRLLEERGHRHFQSNWSHYRDIALQSGDHSRAVLDGAAHGAHVTVAPADDDADYLADLALRVELLEERLSRLRQLVINALESARARQAATMQSTEVDHDRN